MNRRCGLDVMNLLDVMFAHVSTSPLRIKASDLIEQNTLMD